MISTKKDLGCRSSVVLSTIDEVKSHLGVGKAFWSAIGGQGDYQGNSQPEFSGFKLPADIQCVQVQVP